MHWTAANNMKINISKTKEIIFSGRINIDDDKWLKRLESFPDIEQVTEAKLLGLVLDNKLTWNVHLNGICKKAKQLTYLLLLLKSTNINERELAMLAKALVCPHFNYAAVVWGGGANKNFSKKFNKIKFN
jgi:hypothetical protein